MRIRDPRPPRAVLTLLVVAACSDGDAPAPVAPAVAGPSPAATSAHVGPVGEVEPVLSFDAAAGEFPEGLAFDRRGTMYVTLPPLAQVLEIEPDGSRSVLATLDPALAPGAVGTVGLATDARGRVYAALASFNPATHGVYRIATDGTATRLPGTADIGFPNGLARDDRGNLYVTDSATGTVWRVPRGGSATPWIQHELLEGTGAFGLGVPIGANGIAWLRGDVFVANSEKGLVLRVPVEGDGSAGPPSIVTGGQELFGIDGLEVDAHGRLYGAVNVQDRLVRVDPGTGEVTDLAGPGDGLDFPASLAFGTVRGLQRTLFVTNFAFLDDPASPTPPGPGIVRIDAGVPGRPLH